MPSIISAFQLVRIFSSRPGRTRVSRALNSFDCAEVNSDSHCSIGQANVLATSASGTATTKFQKCTSKLAG